MSSGRNQILKRIISKRGHCRSWLLGAGAGDAHPTGDVCARESTQQTQCSTERNAALSRLRDTDGVLLCGRPRPQVSLLSVPGTHGAKAWGCVPVEEAARPEDRRFDSRATPDKSTGPSEFLCRRQILTVDQPSRIAVGFRSRSVQALDLGERFTQATASSMSLASQSRSRRPARGFRRKAVDAFFENGKPADGILIFTAATS